MRRLNRAASEALVATVSAATDVTGFGLLGHGLEMARASGTSSRSRRRPAPARGCSRMAAAGVETGGAAHNRRFVAGSLGRPRRPADLVALAHDPQTSGGLLAAVAPDTSTLESAFDAAGIERWWIGTVAAGQPRVGLI